jgi:hypothetical protein
MILSFLKHSNGFWSIMFWMGIANEKPGKQSNLVIDLYNFSLIVQQQIFESVYFY